MPSKVSGDFSKYPEAIREVFPYLFGETCVLRSDWQVYHHLFIANEGRTSIFADHLGALLGTFQNQLQDKMFISISRFTDRDRGPYKYLSLWTLVDCCQSWDPVVAIELSTQVEKLESSVQNIRAHRHRRLAHYGLSVSLERTALPVVLLSEIKEAIKNIELVINFVARKACNTTIFFEVLDHRDITSAAEITVCKAAAYDDFVGKGTIASDAWERFFISRNNPQE